MSSPIRIAIVGGGMISQIGHLPFYLADSRCEVVAVAETRPSLVSALSDVIGQERIVAHHKQLFDDPTIDAVVLSLPRPATGPVTLQALRAGKHVLAEKPMAHTVGQARELVAAAHAGGLLYGVGYMKRFDAGVERAKKLFDRIVADGRLGRLLSARFFDYSKAYAFPLPPHTRPEESRTERFPEWPLAPDWLSPDFGELYAWFVNAGSHDVNLLRLFIPEGISVKSAQVSPTGSVTALLRAADVPVTLEVARCSAGRWIEGAEFAFEDGHLAIAVPSPMDTEGAASITLHVRDKGRWNEDTHCSGTGKGWAFARQAHGFLDALEGKCRLRNSGDEGLQDMILIEEIWRSACA